MLVKRGKMSYAYLFKYIIIGDTGECVAVSSKSAVCPIPLVKLSLVLSILHIYPRRSYAASGQRIMFLKLVTIWRNEVI